MHAVSSQSDLTIICYTQLKKSNKEAKKTSKEDRKKLNWRLYPTNQWFHFITAVDVHDSMYLLNLST